MSSATNRIAALGRDRRGTTALEFGLIAIPFFAIMLATTDLGRYFLTQHSLRTLTAEAARSVMVNCFSATGACSLTAAQISAVEAAAPFLGSTNLTASQTAPQAGTGLRTVNISVSYPFTFIFPVLSISSGPIIDTAAMTY